MATVFLMGLDACVWHLSVSIYHVSAPEKLSQLWIPAYYLLWRKAPNGSKSPVQRMWRWSLPMLLWWFLSFEQDSTRGQVIVYSLVVSAFSVNRVSSASDRCRLLPTSRYPCPSSSAPFADVFEVKIRYRLCTLAGGHFPAQKDIQNHIINRLLFLVFY